MYQSTAFVKLKRPAQVKPLILPSLSVLNFIFDTQFSTYETVNDLSGRGIGLAAVKIELEKLNGQIEIDTEINKGTSFNFKIPLISL